MDPIKYNVNYLWLIFCDHDLFSLNDGLKFVNTWLFDRRTSLANRTLSGIDKDNAIGK